MQVDPRQELEELLHVQTSISAAFGDLQVLLLRELSVQLKAHGASVADTLPLDASCDQLDAAVRDVLHALRPAPADLT
ncbi:hypothetical protein OWR29_47405 [Actinoplanes sp. Pm04-4]|uniref:Uncharacterized protein n=1 Tax=Paractinoplanes pyxinae TaxID=2997416 RepID=A0ABT4BGL1_9ACTN|nr:hypothetical protein [Actinoplanes pyxinae]MCY1145679.1 hypothetical protein [Actinoplanes pyxinae]